MIDIERLVEDYELTCGTTREAIHNIELVTDTHITLRYSEYNYGIVVNRKTGVATGYETDDRPWRLRKKARHEPVDEFQIRAVHQDWAKDQFIVIETYPTIDAAKAAQAKHQEAARETDSPFSFRIKKETIMADVFDFEDWARFRFETGDWQPLPWANEPWANKHPEHFAHQSKVDDARVAFWASTAEAQRDEAATLTAGRYLQRFYSDVLSPTDIESWVHKMDPPGELVLSGPGPEDIYNAYQRCAEEGGVSSCMSYEDDTEDNDGDDGKWAGDGNPVRVYGAGDLQVAMLVRKGRAVARALVWPEKKVSGRRYGDCGRMKQALIDAGYTLDGDSGNSMDTYGRGGFNGARLLKIPVGRSDFVAPYIDLHYRMRDAGDHFVMDTEGGNYAHRTDGLLKGTDMCSCEWCDRTVDEDDTYRVDGDTICERCYTRQVVSCDECSRDMHRDNSYGVQDASYCYHCYVDHTSDCGECSDRFHNDDLTDGHCASCEPELEEAA